MKILNISLDKKIFDPDSKAAKRVSAYGGLFEKFDFVVLTLRGYRVSVFGKNQAVPTNSSSRFGYLPTAYRLAKKMMEENNYDWVASQDPFEMGILSFILARKYKTKLQVQIHGDYFGSLYWRKESLANRLRFYLGKFVVKRADLVRTVSHRTKESLVKLGVPAHKIIVLPIYSEVAERDLVANKENGNGEFVFLTVGRLVKVKNIRLQLEALKETLQICPQAMLWIVGDGPERKALENLSKSLEIAERVKFFGWQENLDRFYSEADAFVLSSNYEGWGMVAIEAASFGLPILMTDVGCAGEVIKDGESGVVIEVGNRSALAAAMQKIMTDKEFAQKIGRQAQEETKSLPTEAKYLDLFKKSFTISA